jgi:hypothetical protein
MGAQAMTPHADLPGQERGVTHSIRVPRRVPTLPLSAVPPIAAGRAAVAVLRGRINPHVVTFAARERELPRRYDGQPQSE